MRWESKRADEVRTYRHAWSAFLGAATIADVDVSVTGATKDSESYDTNSVTVTISGGAAATTAIVTMTITSSAGDIETEVFTLAITAFDEPVSLADAKAHLRVTDDSEDELIARLVRSARQRVEKFTGVLLARRTVTQTFDTFGLALELLNWPVSSVTSVGYVDSDGADQVYADFLAVLGRNPARVYPARDGWWPALGRYGEVTATYVAGYAPGEAPEDLLQAVLDLVAFWFENRGNGGDMPGTVKEILDGYRRILI